MSLGCKCENQGECGLCGFLSSFLAEAFLGNVGPGDGVLLTWVRNGVPSATTAELCIYLRVLWSFCKGVLRQGPSGRSGSSAGSAGDQRPPSEYPRSAA